MGRFHASQTHPPIAAARWTLHDLVLSQSIVGIRIHRLSASLVQVLDEAQVEGTTAVLVPLEFGDGCVGRVGTVEADDAAAARATAWLVLYLSLLNLADSSEELY